MREKTKIVFLILPRVHLLDLAGPMQVFQEAAEQGVNVSMEYCSFTTSLSSSSEFPFGTLKHRSKIQFNKGDYLLIPGAEVSYLLSRDLAQQTELKDWVTSAWEQGVQLASICTGAFYLASTGLLNNRTCTTHWKRAEELQLKYPKVRVESDILFTDQDGIMTSAGVTAGIDLALHIVSKLSDEHTAFKVARELVIYSRRNGHEPQQSLFVQYRNHINSGIHRFRIIFRTNLRKDRLFRSCRTLRV